VKITSPFVTKSICEKIYQVKKPKVSFELITSFKLPNASTGSLDLAALEYIISKGGMVKNYQNLHSKIYLFDDSHAVITSGNLTNGGLIKNFEYGIFVDESSLVAKIIHDFQMLSADRITGKVEQRHIIEARKIIENIPRPSVSLFPAFTIETPDSQYDFSKNAIPAINSILEGWRLSIFQCLQKLAQQEFSLNDVYAFEQELQKDYPENNNIKPQIRK